MSILYQQTLKQPPNLIATHGSMDHLMNVRNPVEEVSEQGIQDSCKIM